MSIHEDLRAIDDYEEKFGNPETVTRACDLMVSFLVQSTKPLPEIASQALQIAIKYKNGEIASAELESPLQAVQAFLRQRGAITDYETPEHCAVHAVWGILGCYQKPEWGGGVSEVVFYFLDMMGKFGVDHEGVRPLLKEYFPPQSP